MDNCLFNICQRIIIGDDRELASNAFKHFPKKNVTGLRPAGDDEILLF